MHWGYFISCPYSRSSGETIKADDKIEHLEKSHEKNIFNLNDNISSDIRNIASKTCLMIACHDKNIEAAKLFQVSISLTFYEQLFSL